MNNQNQMRQVTVIMVISLFIGTAFAPTVAAKKFYDHDYVELTIEFLGFNDEKTYSLEVSSSKAIEIKEILDKHAESLKNADSYHLSIKVMKNVLHALKEHGLIDKNSVNSLVDYSQKYNVNKNYGLMQNVLCENIFSFLIMNVSRENVIDRAISSEMLGVLCFLPFILFKTGHILLAFLSVIIVEVLRPPLGLLFLYCQFKPLKFWVIIKAFPEDLWSFGLKGFKHTKESRVWIVGFKGIKITLFDTAFYIGHSLAICSKV